MATTFLFGASILYILISIGYYKINKKGLCILMAILGIVLATLALCTYKI